MITLPTPTVSYSSIVTSINGDTYTLQYRWMERIERWKVNIKDSSGKYLVKGITILEDSILTAHLSTLNNTLQGILYTVKLEQGSGVIGRDNLGFNKTYELTYASFDELASLVS